MLCGKTITVWVDSNSSIGKIKEQIYETHVIPPMQQRLIFGGRELNDDQTISDCNIADQAILHLALRLGRRRWCSEEQEIKINMEMENLEMNKVGDIQIGSDQFIALLDESMKLYHVEMPDAVLRVVYEYAKCIGGPRNFKCQWNKLHSAASKGDIDAANALLKEGYYVDQWCPTDNHNPLFCAITICIPPSVDMVEFLLINGARRRTRELASEMMRKSIHYEIQRIDKDIRAELFKMLSSYALEDPLK